jgi:SAM-dependent methyltransferase
MRVSTPPSANEGGALPLSHGCPLCGRSAHRPSWLGATVYFEQRFEYVECLSCGTSYCDPMPDTRTLAHMYGPAYGSMPEATFDVGDPKEPQRVVDWLSKSPRGIFLDYGCGEGRLLKEALRAGWKAVGFELDPQVARRTAEQTGAEVFCDIAELRRQVRPDVMNLGDVIEHLTELRRQMPELLEILRPGGILLAQGPLEANANLFTLVLRGQRRLRQRPVADFPPYHVLLATGRGQRDFFRRFGLDELEYRISEVAWPAPSRLHAEDLARPRVFGMFALRRLSQFLSGLRPSNWGNRYFYAGRRGTSHP